MRDIAKIVKKALKEAQRIYPVGKA